LDVVHCSKKESSVQHRGQLDLSVITEKTISVVWKKRATEKEAMSTKKCWYKITVNMPCCMYFSRTYPTIRSIGADRTCPVSLGGVMRLLYVKSPEERAKLGSRNRMLRHTSIERIAG
jgi:hypothetical protein